MALVPGRTARQRAHIHTHTHIYHHQPHIPSPPPRTHTHTTYTRRHPCNVFTRRCLCARATAGRSSALQTPLMAIMTPPPLWKDGAYGMEQSVLNDVMPGLVPHIATAAGKANPRPALPCCTMRHRASACPPPGVGDAGLGKGVAPVPKHVQPLLERATAPTNPPAHSHPPTHTPRACRADAPRACPGGWAGLPAPINIYTALGGTSKWRDTYPQCGCHRPPAPPAHPPKPTSTGRVRAAGTVGGTPSDLFRSVSSTHHHHHHHHHPPSCGDKMWRDFGSWAHAARGDDP